MALFLPTIERLNIKKPTIDPISKTSIESYIRSDAKPINKSATIAQPELNPFIPSIILKAFIIPITQKIVKGIPRYPR